MLKRLGFVATVSVLAALAIVAAAVARPASSAAALIWTGWGAAR